jgi:hypothetical protein
MKDMDLELVSAADLDEKKILRRSTTYKMVRLGLLPYYVVGPSQKGIRFRVCEVLEALQRGVRAPIASDEPATREAGKCEAVNSWVGK